MNSTTQMLHPGGLVYPFLNNRLSQVNLKLKFWKKNDTA